MLKKRKWIKKVILLKKEEKIIENIFKKATKFVKKKEEYWLKKRWKSKIKCKKNEKTKTFVTKKKQAKSLEI